MNVWMDTQVHPIQRGSSASVYLVLWGKTRQREGALGVGLVTSFSGLVSEYVYVYWGIHAM